MAIYNGTGTTVTRTDGTLEPGVPMKYFETQADLDEYLKTNPTGDWYAAVADKTYKNLVYATPEEVTLDLKAGQVAKGNKFTVYNTTDATQYLDFTFTNDWIHLDQTPDSLEPGASVEISYVVVVPTSASGVYLAVLDIKRSPDQATLDSSSNHSYVKITMEVS